MGNLKMKFINLIFAAAACLSSTLTLESNKVETEVIRRRDEDELEGDIEDGIEMHIDIPTREDEDGEHRYLDFQEKKKKKKREEADKELKKTKVSREENELYRNRNRKPASKPRRTKKRSNSELYLNKNRKPASNREDQDTLLEEEN